MPENRYHRIDDRYLMVEYNNTDYLPYYDHQSMVAIPWPSVHSCQPISASGRNPVT